MNIIKKLSSCVCLRKNEMVICRSYQTVEGWEICNFCWFTMSIRSSKLGRIWVILINVSSAKETRESESCDRNSVSGPSAGRKLRQFTKGKKVLYLDWNFSKRLMIELKVISVLILSIGLDGGNQKSIGK